MNSSFSDWNHFPENQAKGYHKENGMLVPTSYFHPAQFLGSGNLSSNVDDLYKWYNAIYKTGKISSEHQITHFGRIGGWTSTCFIPNGAADYVIILLSNYGEAPVDMIFPKSKTDFFWMVVNASVKFIPDSTGLITQVIHSQVGQTILAPKIKN